MKPPEVAADRPRGLKLLWAVLTRYPKALAIGGDFARDHVVVAADQCLESRCRRIFSAVELAHRLGRPCPLAS